MIEDAQQLQDWGIRHVGLSTWKGMAAACKTNQPSPLKYSRCFSATTEMLSLKGNRLCVWPPRCLYVYVSVFVLFKELVHNQS